MTVEATDEKLAQSQQHDYANRLEKAVQELGEFLELDELWLVGTVILKDGNGGRHELAGLETIIDGSAVIAELNRKIRELRTSANG